MAIIIKGLEELRTNMARISVQAPVAVANGQYEGLQNIMVDAKERAPRLTDTMANSGYVTEPEVKGGAAVSCEAGFGGGSEDYVLRQHEDTSLNHPRGGEAHFFSNALDAGQDALFAAIVKHVEIFLETKRTVKPQKIVPNTPYEQAQTDFLPGATDGPPSRGG